MRAMVLDIPDLAPEFLPRKGVVNQFGQAAPGMAVADAVQHQAQVRPLAQHIADLARQAGLAVLIDGQHIDVAGLQTCFVQAVANGFRGEARPVLDPAQAFLFQRGDQFPATHQTGRAVTVKGVHAKDDHATFPVLKPVRTDE